MRLLSMFLLVFAFLAVSACTDDETVTIEKTQCFDKSVVTGDETCPDPPVEDNQSSATDDLPTTNNQGGDDDTPTSSECHFQIPVTDLDYTAGTGDEKICGNEKDNIIRGGDGDDTLYGKAGNDTLYGGKDRDTLKGEAGDDTLIGEGGNDLLDGGDGTDTVDYGQEETANTGAMGIDVDLEAGSAVDTYVDDDTLKDVENVIGTTLADKIKGDSGPNVIDGNGASDGSDMLDGRGGEDTIVVSTTPFDLSSVQDESGAEPNIKGFENIRGKLPQNPTGLILRGDGGINKITGTDLDDTLYGRAGNDTLMGLKGVDVFVGGPGRDIFIGGIGNDCFQLSVNDLDTSIKDFEEGDMVRLYISSDDQMKYDELATKSNDAEKGISGLEVSAVAKDGEVRLVQTYTLTIEDNPDTTVDEASVESKEEKIRTLITIPKFKEDSDYQAGLCTGVDANDI